MISQIVKLRGFDGVEKREVERTGKEEGVRAAAGEGKAGHRCKRHTRGGQPACPGEEPAEPGQEQEGVQEFVEAGVFAGWRAQRTRAPARGASARRAFAAR